MVHIKRVELSHFKSFGGTTAVPLLDGFTVISGPNGSGKSNILDALLFALGLSSSKGMRAERLPDLVNQTHSGRGRSTVEASVTVTFDLSGVVDDLAQDMASGNGNGAQDEEGDRPDWLSLREWSVTRKLRVTPQGTYTSTYSINGVPCTLTDLHEQLGRLRIYPEGYNVVLQGDVTGIISMNPRERRQIIDELAGVAAFDRKIDQAKEKLDAVREREDRFRIVERELMAQRDRLAQDRIKAEKYQKLRSQLQEKSQWEGVLVWRASQNRLQQLQAAMAEGDRQRLEKQAQLVSLTQAIETAGADLETLNQRVKALGEEEQLALQATLATQEAEQRQLQRQVQSLEAAQKSLVEQIAQTQQDLESHRQTLTSLVQQRTQIDTRDLAALRQAQAEAQRALEASREAASDIAAQSEAWVQEQTQLHRQIEDLQKVVNPGRSEEARLRERLSQLGEQIKAETQEIEALGAELTEKQAELAIAETKLTETQTLVANLAQTLAATEQDLQIQQETQTRLLKEQRDKQRQLDKLEAQSQALQESQGTYATKLIVQTGMPGLCGLVAQLGRVDSRYQLALETAAGARLGHLVVEDDSVAAACIELLKQRRAGRATFLPLNKIQAPRFQKLSPWQRPEGFVDYAVELIDCDDRYRDIFAYVFGSTVVFSSLAEARRVLGQFRIVTLEGELLETSGAMTGGSVSQASTLHFGTVEAGESAEAIALKTRLSEIDRLLGRVEGAIAQAAINARQQSQALAEARTNQREQQLLVQQLQGAIQRLTPQKAQRQIQRSNHTQEIATSQTRLQTLEVQLQEQEAQLQQWRQALAALEESQTHSEWQQLQAQIRDREAALAEKTSALRVAEQRLQDLDNQRDRLQEKIQQAQQKLQEARSQQTGQIQQQSVLQDQITAQAAQIQATQTSLAALEQTLGAEKEKRDRAERQYREQQTQRQQLEWQIQKLQETQEAQQLQHQELTTQLEAQWAELPDPLPEVPADLGLEQLQQELRSLTKRLEAMEPVNMLALEEFDRTQARLDELSQKLTTLESERTELLLRIENFTTLRQRAFKDAFDAVNQNFQAIFAELSDGDGYLQLDDPEDPFASGLNLVAHPKGKPVRRLASMSGGEKSLTALSFIFALQRYRPSPFYAFDEVDMFLDGANVERLARMIRQQADLAQFIVVSLRRPMIESADRTIGVTQARGAFTQVLGIQLHSQGTSV